MTDAELKVALENLDELERKASSGMPTNAKYRALDLASRSLIRPMLGLLAECGDGIELMYQRCAYPDELQRIRNALLAKLPREKP